MDYKGLDDKKGRVEKRTVLTVREIGLLKVIHNFPLLKLIK